MPRVPLMSSKELVRLLEKVEQYLLDKGQQIMQYIQGSLKAEDILRLYRWVRNP